jgi:hypothetical protein
MFETLLGSLKDEIFFLKRTQSGLSIHSNTQTIKFSKKLENRPIVGFTTMEEYWAIHKICVKFCTVAKSKNEIRPSQRIILEKNQKFHENFKGA